MARVRASYQEIMDVFNKTQKLDDVCKWFGWKSGYAQYMVDEAKRQLNKAASSPVATQPAVQAPVQTQAVIEPVAENATATVVKEDASGELKKVEVPVAEASVNKDNPNLAVLRSKIDPKQMTPEKSRVYIKRKVDEIVEDFAKLKRNICLIGDSGTGKTTLVEQFAAGHTLPFLRISCDETSSLKTLLGSKEIINGTTYFRGGILLELIQMPSVILFDEFNALHSSKLFFLHELLDNRRLFVQDADGGKVISIHPECQIFLACNPANKNYGGTNKMNAALGNRTTVIDVPNIKVSEMKELFECGTHTQSMIQFYEEASRAISDKNLRVAFSLRNIQRATEAINAGIKPYLALRYEFYNAALLTASEVERDVFEGIALRIFGK